jgi:hypothetical protein
MNISIKDGGALKTISVPSVARVDFADAYHQAQPVIDGAYTEIDLFCGCGTRVGMSEDNKVFWCPRCGDEKTLTVSINIL